MECKKGSNIAKHAWDYDHKIDFENGKVVDSGNYRTQKTLESWHTATITNSDNNSKPLPKQYMLRLFAKFVIANYFLLLGLVFQYTTWTYFLFRFSPSRATVR